MIRFSEMTAGSTERKVHTTNEEKKRETDSSRSRMTEVKWSYMDLRQPKWPLKSDQGFWKHITCHPQKTHIFFCILQWHDNGMIFDWLIGGLASLCLADGWECNKCFLNPKWVSGSLRVENPAERKQTRWFTGLFYSCSKWYRWCYKFRNL